MANCKFLKQKKQVQINGEWVDTRSYRYLPYCDGKTPHLYVKGGEENNPVTIHMYNPGQGEIRKTVYLDKNGELYLELKSDNIIYGLSFLNHPEFVEIAGCYVHSVSDYTPYDTTLSISCSTFSVDRSDVNVKPSGFYYKKLILDSFDISNVTNGESMFENSSCESIEGLQTIDTSSLENMSLMFYGCSNLTSLDLSNFITSKVKYMNYMFTGCKSLNALDLSNFNVSKVYKMYGMFSGCSNLESLDLSRFITPNLKVMDYMFNGCTNLKSIDVSNLNTSKVKDMIGVFQNCSSLTSLDLSSFDTSLVKDMSNMFKGCTSLTSLDLSNFNCKNINSIDGMFENCSGLTSLNLSGFKPNFTDDSNVDTSMAHLFYGCRNLKHLDLSGWHIGLFTYSSGMFCECVNLETLNLSNWYWGSYGYPAKDTWSYCRSLKTIYMQNCNENVIRWVKDGLKYEGILDQVTIIT